MNHSFGFGGMAWSMWLIFIVIPALLIIGAYGVFKHGRNPDDDALAILKRRYAKGEINRDEFERLKRDIQNL